MRRADWIKELPSQEALCNQFELGHDDNGCGCLIMRLDYPHGNGKRKGEIARFKTVNGYHRVKFGGIVYLEHRIVWKMVHGLDPVGDIDHINGKRNDNSPENLRDVFAYENMRNKSNNTEYPGIQYNERGYVVATMALSFCNLELAIEYRDKMEAVLLPLIREFKTRNRVAKPDPRPEFDINELMEAIGMTKEKVNV